MLYTLHSYIGRELGKIFAIVALALTMVLSLGGLLQPLRENGVSATQLFQLLIYFFPMMMTFSLPVSALLSATLVYGRLSADNELIACRASGISMWSLILPGAALGMFVLVTNLLLSNWFIPGCAQRAKDLIRRDAQEIAYNKLKTYHQFNWNRVVLSAENVEEDGKGGMLLTGVSFTQLGVTKNDPPMDKITIAETTELEFDTARGVVMVKPRKAVSMLWAGGEPAHVEELPLSWPIPQLTRDDVSFRTYGELVAMLRSPDLHSRVKGPLILCRRWLAQQALCEDIRASLAAPPHSYAMKYEGKPDDPAVLCDAQIWTDQVRTINANDDPAGGLVLGSGDAGARGKPAVPWTTPGVVITLRPASDSPDATCIRYRAGKADVRVVLRDEQLAPLVAVTFLTDYRRNVEPISADPFRPVASAGTQPNDEAHNPSRVMTERLIPVRRLTDKVAGLSLAEVEKAVPVNQDVRRGLELGIGWVRRNVVAELHSRAAFSVAGLVLVLLGAALGVLFRSGHALVAFGVAAVPAMFAITLVILGNQIATSDRSVLQPFGLWFIWSGNAVTVGLNVWVYSRMLKH